MELSSSYIKKFLISSYILGNGNPDSPNLSKIYNPKNLNEIFVCSLILFFMTPLGQTGCLRNLYYLLAPQASSFFI